MRKFTILLLALSILFPFPAHAADGILPIERQIATSPTECGAGWRADGSLAFSRCGDSQYTFALTDDEKAAISEGGTFTHNHPEPGCWTLSPQDVEFASLEQLNEIRVVGIRDGILRVSIMRRTGDIFQYVSDDVANAEARQFLPISGDFDGCNALSAAWQALATRYGFEYQVISE